MPHYELAKIVCAFAIFLRERYDIPRSVDFSSSGFVHLVQHARERTRRGIAGVEKIVDVDPVSYEQFEHLERSGRVNFNIIFRDERRRR